jgi:putative membrane protein
MKRLMQTAIAVMAMSAANVQAQEAVRSAQAFVNDMAIAGMAEVQLGKLATERAASAEVKAFGQTMVKDHSQANDELKNAASQVNAQLPTQLDQKHQALADRLSKLQGAPFDREYMTAMVQGHEEVAGRLRARAVNRSTSNTPTRPGSAAVGTTGDASGREDAVTQWATKALPTVEQHLQHAKELQKKVAK